MTALDLAPVAFVVLALSALLVGVAKTSVGGMGALAVAGFALFLPARESTAAVLLLLIVGDLVAVASYRHSADWALLRRLLPAVVPGIALGALLMEVVDDRAMTVVIAVAILSAVALQLAVRRRQQAGSVVPTTTTTTTTTTPSPAPVPRSRPHSRTYNAASILTGVAAGFTTMVANAAGPVMALYLLASRVDKMRFVGTMAWFYLLVNVAKVPFAAGLGLFPGTTLWITLLLAPLVLLGTWLGRRLLRRLTQRQFEVITLGAAVLAGLILLVRAAVGH